MLYYKHNVVTIAEWIVMLSEDQVSSPNSTNIHTIEFFQFTFASYPALRSCFWHEIKPPHNKPSAVFRRVKINCRPLDLLENIKTHTKNWRRFSAMRQLYLYKDKNLPICTVFYYFFILRALCQLYFAEYSQRRSTTDPRSEIYR